MKKVIELAEELRSVLSDSGKLEDAENAIRDMFLSKQYKGKVPTDDLNTILAKGSRWAKMFGKATMKEAWKNLSDYVSKQGRFWIWKDM